MAVRKAKQRRNQPTKVRCPLCFRDSKVSCKTLDSGNLDVTCPERCGAFEIEDSVVRKFANLSAFDRGLLPYLRCHVRQSHERKEKARITEDNWKTLAEKRRSTPVKYKWKCLLDLLARRAERSLTGIKKFDSRIDGLLVDAPFRGDFEVLVSYLVEQGYIYRNHEDSEGEWAPDWYNLTVEGLSKYEDLTQPGPAADKVSKSGAEGIREPQGWRNKTVLTPAEAASILRVELRTIYNYLNAGELVETEMTGKKSAPRRILRESVEKMLKPKYKV